MRVRRSLLISLLIFGAGCGLGTGIAWLGGIQLGQASTATTETVAQSPTPQSGKIEVTSTSGPAEIALAKHLRQIGAKMYGAYWCPHCHDQVALFGKEAAPSIPYIECAEDGANSQTNLCRKAEIKGFPTWKIKGKTYEGTQSLEDLAKVSGYRGNRNFKNILP